MADLNVFKGLNDNFFYKLGGQLYEYIVDRYGDDDENAERDLTIPFMCDGWFKGRTGYGAEYFDPWNTYVTCDYMFNIAIDGNYNTENFITTYIPVWTDSKYGDVSIEDAYNHVRNSSTTGSYLDDAIHGLDYAQQQAEIFKLRLNDGMSQQTIYSQYTNYGIQYYTELFTYNDNQTILDSFTRYNLYQNPPVDVTNITSIKFDTNNGITYLNQAHSSNPVATDISFDRSFNLFTISDNNTATNIYNTNNSEYNNSFQYTTNEGDTINVYYGDNYIDLGIGGLGGGAGGLVGFNYNDFKLIMDDIIDDLKINVPDINISPDYQFPTFEEIKYVDMGSFYITPIKQIDKLPAAPDIADTVIDVSEPLNMLSSGFGALLSSFDSLGVTLTLTFTFLACLVINKLRGD